ncbi:MAG: M20/M25/M40 family metallo-hydrolase [Christensenellales bacterium]
MKPDIYNKINTERLIDTMIELIKIDSESGDEKAVADHLKSLFTSLGATCELQILPDKVKTNSGNLFVRFAGTKAECDPLLFSCHMDTVQPGKNIVPIRHDDRITSDGTTILGADDKAGIAALIETIRLIQENDLPCCDIEILLTVCEETGLLGARYADLDKVKAKMAFVLDSSDPPGSFVVNGVAQDKINVVVTGKEAHAGVAPEEGVSALVIAAKALANMKLLRVSKQTTANFSRIEGGGATNIVTGRVELFGEARSLDEAELNAQVAHMRACFEEAAASERGQVEFTAERMYAGFQVNPTSDILALGQAACHKAGLPYKELSSGGGSDTNVYNARGLPAVTLGIGEQKPHSRDEFVLIKDLEDTVKLVLGLIDSQQKKG